MANDLHSNGRPGEHEGSVDILSLQRQLRSIVDECDEREAFVNAVLRLVVSLTNADAAIWWTRDTTGKPKCSARCCRDDRADELDGLMRAAAELAEDAIETDKAQVRRPGSSGEAAQICSPVAGDGQAREAVGLCLRLGRESIESFAVILQLVSGYFAFWQSAHSHARVEWEAAMGAALVELLAKVTDSEELPRACYVLANELQSFLHCTKVGVGLVPPSGGACRLKAISEVAAFDQRSETARLIERAFRESLDHADIVTWPPPESADVRRLPAHRALSKNVCAGPMVTGPLRTANGDLVGAWVFMWTNQTELPRSHVGLIRAAERPVAAALAASAGRSRGRVGSFLGKIFKHGGRRRVLTRLVATAAVIGLTLLPVFPHKTRCDCTVRPVVKRTVCAPFDGVLEKSLARIGDVVSSNQLLAVLDGREIKMELAGLVAERHRAEKMGDVNLAGTKVAAAQMARYEQEKLAQQIRLLEHRVENLEVKAPVAGIVISGDLDRAEGVPLQTGQALFDIAPLDTMVIELAVSDADLAFVHESMPVEARFDSYPGDEWRGQLQKIQPQSTVREMKNVFLAEMLVDNTDDRLRPGMSGRANVVGDRRPLLWLLLRRPWQFLVLKLEGF